MLPMAAFRPCRCQQRPCQSVLLPPDRGVLTKSGVHSMLGTHRNAKPNKVRRLKKQVDLSVYLINITFLTSLNPDLELILRK